MVYDLNDARVKELLNRPDVTAEFPQLKAAYKEASAAVVKAATCGACARRARSAAAGMTAFKQAVAGLGAAAVKRFKALVGATAVRVVYRDAGNRVRAVTL